MVKSTFKKIISSLLGFFGIMTFTSCYGMPVNDDWISLYGKVTGDDDGTAETPAVPIKGIKVTACDSDGNEIASSTTDENGEYYMEFEKSSEEMPNSLVYMFEDTDGAENGSYKTKTVTRELSSEDEIYQNYDVELERDETTSGN